LDTFFENGGAQGVFLSERLFLRERAARRANARLPLGSLRAAIKAALGTSLASLGR